MNLVALLFSSAILFFSPVEAPTCLANSNPTHATAQTLEIPEITMMDRYERYLPEPGFQHFPTRNA